VWRITLPNGASKLYVGRTGDSSSPNAQSPINRLGQHLGSNEKSSALRSNLLNYRITPEDCQAIEFIAHGPILPEVETVDGKRCFIAHKPLRDEVAALEKALADNLRWAGYDVLNTVGSKKPESVHLNIDKAAS
jgi:hypothetical protein